MKKVTLLFLLLSTLLMAQNKPDWDYDSNIPINAYFPIRLPFSLKYFAFQNTYNEQNWVSNNLANLITKNLDLGQVSSENKISYIEEIYKTSAGRLIDNLKIKYYVFDIYGFYIVSKIEITGSQAQVSKLFVYLYNTNIQSGNSPINGFQKAYQQDNAYYNIIDGKASIKISNETYKNKNEFKIDFDKRKEKYKLDLIVEKSKEEQAKIDAEKNRIQNEIENENWKKNKIQEIKQDSIKRKEWRDAEPKRTSVNIYFKKLKNEFEFILNSKEEIKDKIREQAKDHKKGNYIAYVVTTTIKDISTYEIKITATDKEF